MSAEALTARGETLAWKAGSLRVTIFLGPSASMPNPDEWQELTGGLPEKKLDLPKARTVQCEGGFAAGNLIFRAAPTRVDWIYSVRLDPDASAPPEITIGPYSECVEAFVPPISHWLENCAHVQRLAYGADLFLPVQSHEDGYILLSDLLHSVTVDPATKDFRYQINRPRQSTAARFDLQLNRVSSWSVVVMQLVEVTVSGDQGHVHRERKGHSCRLELDINTAADRKDDLPQDLLPALLKELVSLGEEIAQRGDIA